MPGGKGPASPSNGDSFVSGNLGLIALFAGVVLIFGGIVAANQAGLFSEDQGASGEILGCDESFVGSSVHEHANLEVYLDSDQPYDFSQQRYQLADNRIHFEGGDGRTVHVHEARPTLGCLLETLNWEVDQDESGEPTRIETDQGDVYEADGGEIEILVGGQPAERGFNEPIEQGERFVIRYTPAAEEPAGNETNDTGDANGGNETG